MKPNRISWTAAFVVVTVALSALAVRFDVQRPAVAILAGSECSDEDNTAGGAGQDLDCDFQCTHPGVGTLEVDAVDPDADVSGTAKCGDTAMLHCTGDQKCAEDGPTNNGGEGYCEGHSQETIDSGLYIKCTAGAVPASAPPVPTIREWCPIKIDPSPPYPAICLDPNPVSDRCEQAVGAPCEVYYDTCPQDDCTTQASGSGSSGWPVNTCKISLDTSPDSWCAAGADAGAKANATRALAAFALRAFNGTADRGGLHLFMFEGLALGLRCYGFNCMQVPPVCAMMEGSRKGCGIS